jgi:hypothetical protein
MSDLKPLGSEKLNGDAKLQRILELTYYGNNKKASNRKAELVKESKSGGVYGIVKEKDGYYVKRGLNESSLDYIGGIFMKNKNRFQSYAEALKRLELLKGQEELNEATKYVLKPKLETEVAAPVPAPAEEPAPVPVPADDTAAPAPTDMPPAADTSAPAPEGGDDEKAGMRSSYMEEIQKFAGKLGQELRDQHEKLESDDIKYVLNMIISAVDLEKLSDDDIKEIGKKFDREDEEAAEEPTSEPAAEEPTAAPAPSAETDLSEDDAMAALDEFINAPAVEDESYDLDEVNLDDFSVDHDSDIEDTYGDRPKLSNKDLGWEVPSDDEEDHMDHEMGDVEHDMNEMDDMVDEDETKEIDLEEIKKQLSQAIGDTLSKHFS